MADLDQRIQVFRNILAADPDNELANFSLGKLLVQSGEHVEAERALRKALELNPRLSACIQLLGEVLIQAGRRDEAVPLLQEGVRIAHAGGEFQPRNRMRELLAGLGVEPPEPEAERSGDGSPTGDWVCARCGVDNARLERKPFPNDLGGQIQERICTACWEEWKQMSVKVINEYRLNLSTDEGSRVYDDHMKEFLGLS